MIDQCSRNCSSGSNRDSRCLHHGMMQLTHRYATDKNNTLCFSDFLTTRQRISLWQNHTSHLSCMLTSNSFINVLNQTHLLSSIGSNSFKLHQGSCIIIDILL